MKKELIAVLVLSIFLISLVSAEDENRFRAMGDAGAEVSSEIEVDSCIEEGGSLGPVIANNTIECCEGLEAYVPGGILGTRGTCVKIRAREREEIRKNIKEGNYSYTNPGDGRIIKIEKERERIRLRIDNSSADIDLDLEESDETDSEGAKFQANLSNGRKALIKIMPDTASERALERLRLKVCNQSNNCTIVLKETGEGNKTRAGYEIRAEKKVRLFGLFKKRIEVRAEINAENGEIVKVKKPWWSFLASDDS